MRNRYGFSFLISTAVLAAACAHRPTAYSVPTAVACDRAQDEAIHNMVEAMWGRLDETPRSPLSFVVRDRSRSGSGWTRPIPLRERYWTDQCRAALERSTP